jgi:hypothetical protein
MKNLRESEKKCPYEEKGPKRSEVSRQYNSKLKKLFPV